MRNNNLRLDISVSESQQTAYEELKDFRRQETVYDDVQNKGALEPRKKAIKTIGVTIAGLIGLLLVLVKNPSNPGLGFTLGYLLPAGFIFSISALIIRKILRKQE